MSKLKLEIITPNGEIFNGEVSSVSLPGEEGEFGVLPEHASLMTQLKTGIIEIEKDDKNTESILIDWGFVQVDEEKVVVLAKGAVAIRGKNESEITKALDKAKELLESVADSNTAIASVTSRLESAAKSLV